MTKKEKKELIDAQWKEIHEKQVLLQKSDYIAAKIAEGKATKTEYKDKIAERQEWRDAINAAQTEIERLEKIEPEDDEEMTESEAKK